MGGGLVLFGPPPEMVGSGSNSGTQNWCLRRATARSGRRFEFVEVAICWESSPSNSCKPFGG